MSKIISKCSLVSVCLFFLLTILSCRKIKLEPALPGYSNFIEFGNQGMMRNTQYDFFPFDSIDVDTINKLFDFNLEVRFNERCRIQSLPLLLEYRIKANEDIMEKNISLILFTPSGKPVGSGSYGLYEVSVPLLDSIAYSDAFFISVSTPENNTDGIISLGVTAQQL